MATEGFASRRVIVMGKGRVDGRVNGVGGSPDMIAGTSGGYCCRVKRLRSQDGSSRAPNSP